MVQGGAQALSRSLFASMIPRHKSSEFFGFFGVFEKFAGMAGPAVFAFMILATSFRQSVLPLEVMARANGTLQAMSGVLLPLGALTAGVLATLLSVTAGIWIGMIGGLVAILPLLRRAIAELSSMPSEGELPDESGA